MALPRLLPIALLLALFLPLEAHAGSTDPDVLRIEKAGHSVKWNAPLAGREGRYGHAEALVNAPLTKVRETAGAFGQYKNIFGGKLRNIRVVGKENGSTDVYVQVPVMHGMLTLSQVLRFGPAKQVAPGVEQLEGTFVRGTNVNGAHIVITMKEVDENFTVVKCDLLIVPSVPAPQSAVDEELRDAAMNAVDGIHEHAQGRPGTFALNK